MSTSHVRLVVAGLSLILAVFTGLITGFAGGGLGCGDADDSPAPTQPAATSPAVGPNGANSQSPTDDQTVQPPTTPGDDQPTVGGDNSGPNGGNTPPGDPDQGGLDPQLDGVNTFTGQRGTAAVDRDCGGFSVLSAVTGFGGALFTALLAAGVALFAPQRGTTPPAPVGRPVGPAGPAPSRVHTATGSHPVLSDAALSATGAGAGAGAAPATVSLDSRPAKDRRTLVDTCIYVRDRATSKAIADRLAWALNEVGVQEVRPTGQTFDTAQHEAGGTAPTDDSRLDGTIAAVEIPGYTDNGQVLRAPVVTVFRAGGDR